MTDDVADAADEALAPPEPVTQFTDAVTPPTKLSLKSLQSAGIALAQQVGNLEGRLQGMVITVEAGDFRIAELQQAIVILEESIAGIVSTVEATIDSVQPQTEAVMAALERASSQLNSDLAGNGSDFVHDLQIGVIEALRLAGINTASRMAKELEAKWFPSTNEDSKRDWLLDRFPWLSDYR